MHTRIFSARHKAALIPWVWLLAISACTEKTAPPPAPRPVAWVTVQPYSGIETRRLPGLVRAVQRAPLSFEVPGRVTKVNRDIGERFAKGDVLATLDSRTYRLTLEQRRADLEDARAHFTESKQTLARKIELQKRKVGSQAAVDSARAAHDSAQAQVARLQALANLARKDLHDATLNAPYAGEILQRLIEPSQQVRAGATVFQIQGSDGGAEVVVSVPETVVNRLQRGDSVEISFPARPQLELDSEVTEIGAGALERNAFPVTLRLRETPSAVRPGMTAEAHFALNDQAADNANSVAIPITAFLAGKDDQSVAFVFSDDRETVHQRNIRVTDIVGQQALVDQGLEPGEMIVTKGLPYLKDGQRVTRLGVGTERFQQ